MYPVLRRQLPARGGPGTQNIVQLSDIVHSTVSTVTTTDYAQDTCLVCPSGTFTKVETGAVHPSQCKAQCLPGTWSQSGLAR